MIPDPSGQLAELIVYMASTRVDLYSHQILLGTVSADNRVPSVVNFEFDHYSNVKCQDPCMRSDDQIAVHILAQDR